MMKSVKHIGEKMSNRVREKRKNLNLRMIDVAIMSGVGISTIWLAENGYAERVSEKTRKKIACALQCSIQEIFPQKEV